MGLGGLKRAESYLGVPPHTAFNHNPRHFGGEEAGSPAEKKRWEEGNAARLSGAGPQPAQAPWAGKGARSAQAHEGYGDDRAGEGRHGWRKRTGAKGGGGWLLCAGAGGASRRTGRLGALCSSAPHGPEVRTAEGPA